MKISGIFFFFNNIDFNCTFFSGEVCVFFIKNYLNVLHEYLETTIALKSTKTNYILHLRKAAKLQLNGKFIHRLNTSYQYSFRYIFFENFNTENS